jgi:5-(carboxyamino)imidazole ribonucleotide synthase
MHTNPLRTRIGIIGGGQLGRMMIEESMRYNISFNVLDEAGCPCAGIADHHVVGKLDDPAAIRELAGISDVLTWEIEHTNVQALADLEKEGVRIIPSPAVLQIIQDKGLQKQFFSDNHIPTSRFVLADTPRQWWDALNEFSGPRLVAKTRRSGYDGKGVAIFHVEDIRNDASLIPFAVPVVIEEFIACEKELSVIVARDTKGAVCTWPVVGMEFDPVANLVTYLDCPSGMPETIEKKATEIALQAIEALNGTGIFAVEMFVDANGNVLVNEIAPRAHNSGHHTIEASYTSQFEQLVRILCGLPPGSTNMIQPSVMVNLLGPPEFSGQCRLLGLDQIAETEGAYLHLYGKRESRPMRKMGHITVLGNTAAEARQKAHHLASAISFVPDK